MAHHTIDKAECICQDNTKPCQNHLLDSEDKSVFGNGRLSRSGCLGSRESLYKPWFVTITELGTKSDRTNLDSLPAAALPQISIISLEFVDTLPFLGFFISFWARDDYKLFHHWPGQVKWFERLTNSPVYHSPFQCPSSLHVYPYIHHTDLRSQFFQDIMLSQMTGSTINGIRLKRDGANLAAIIMNNTESFMTTVAVLYSLSHG